MPHRIKDSKKGGFIVARGVVAFCAAALSVAVLSVLLLSGCGNTGGSNVSGPPRDNSPVVLSVSTPGTRVVDNNKATLDYSNSSDGYICVMSKLSSTKVKVLVDVDGAQYQYTIETSGSFITIPLSQGNGSYSVGVWENVTGDSYAAVFQQSIDVSLSDEFKPFLYPSQYVDFATGDESTDLSQSLTEGAVTDVDALNDLYDYVINNISYDTQEAVTVASGYLPNNTDTLNKKKGICFDYAVLTASMLRAQRIPAKLVIGYASQAYHAWIQVYCVDSGTVLSYSFNGQSWQRMDPTYDAASKGANDLLAVIGNGNNYQPMFYY